jgi:hypothetical protein
MAKFCKVETLVLDLIFWYNVLVIIIPIYCRYKGSMAFCKVEA